MPERWRERESRSTGTFWATPPRLSMAEAEQRSKPGARNPAQGLTEVAGTQLLESPLCLPGSALAGSCGQKPGPCIKPRLSGMCASQQLG